MANWCHAVVLSTVLIATPALAAEPAPDQTGQPAPPAAVSNAAAQTPTTQIPGAPAKDPDDEIVCKKMDPPTGSRIGARKICHSVREWKRLRAAAKEITDHIQQQGRETNMPGG